MFNTLLPINELFLLALLFFVVFFTISLLFFKRRKLKLLYYTILFFILFFIAIVGGSVQNDGYIRLKKFISLEKNDKLALAKKNLHKYDSMLQIDLQQFNDSNEFKNYLKEYDSMIDRAEAILLSWLLSFLADISIFLAQLLSYLSTAIRCSIKKRKYLCKD